MHIRCTFFFWWNRYHHGRNLFWKVERFKSIEFMSIFSFVQYIHRKKAKRKKEIAKNQFYSHAPTRFFVAVIYLISWSGKNFVPTKQKLCYGIVAFNFEHKKQTKKRTEKERRKKKTIGNIIRCACTKQLYTLCFSW